MSVPDHASVRLIGCGFLNSSARFQSHVTIRSSNMSCRIAGSAGLKSFIDLRPGGGSAIDRHLANNKCAVDDYIRIPDATAFESYEHYLATGLHELCHWTGHEK